MKLWGYYALHTFINSIKKMFRSTFIVVLAIIFGMIILFSVAGGVVGYTLSKYVEDDTEVATEVELLEESSEYVAGSNKADKDIIDDSVTKDDNSDNGDDESLNYEDEMELDISFSFFTKESKMYFIETGVLLVALLFIVLGIFEGCKKGSEIFLMADANLLFTAPLKPQSVMMFRLSFQMIAVFIASFYMLFQIPNLKMNVGISNLGIFAIMAGWVSILLLNKIVSVFVYTISSKYTWIKKYIYVIAIVFILAFTAPAMCIFMSNGRDIACALRDGITPAWTRWIPIVGWYKGMVMYALEGNLMLFIVCTLLLVVGMVAMVYAVWNIKADFYEDALAGAQVRQAIAEQNQKKVNELKKPKKRSRLKRREATLSGKGAVVFFTKEMMLRRKFSPMGIVTTGTIIYFIVAAILLLIQMKFLDSVYAEVPMIAFIVIMYFRNVGNPLGKETDKNWLVLVPEDTYKKVFFALMGTVANTALDLLPAVILVEILVRDNIFIILLWYLVIISVDFMLSTVGLFLEAMLPSSALDNVKELIQVFIKMFESIFVIVAFMVGIIISGFTLALVINLIISLAIGGILFIAYPAMLERGN